jgi:hypothetical protein
VSNVAALSARIAAARQRQCQQQVHTPACNLAVPSKRFTNAAASSVVAVNDDAAV